MVLIHGIIQNHIFVIPNGVPLYRNEVEESPPFAKKTSDLAGILYTEKERFLDSALRAPLEMT